jgi:LAO/AO transport system kinase
VTGPPGAGKSCLVDALITHWRSSGRRPGIIAVDPSSPFTGGAILGDRLRMQRHACDPDVFIRSMGSRGHIGGLSATAVQASEVMAAAGYDPVVFETVGVGQGEVEVASVADATLLVLVPGTGDDVQAMKAGIMEIGDLIVLNKADRPGIDQLESSVRAALDLAPQERRPAVVKCSVLTGEGLEEVFSETDRILGGVVRSPERARRRIREAILRTAAEQGARAAMALLESRRGLDGAVEAVVAGEATPYMIGEEIASILGGQPR